MKILVTGSGGREHGLAWRAAQSPMVSQVFVAPGNAGTANDGKLSNVAIDVMDIGAQIAFAVKENVHLTIIGPEAPLVEGAVDQFRMAGLRCFGPTAKCAQLEGSKSFTKDFLARYNIPTAAYGSFDKVKDAVAYARKMACPMVVKADGLAAGKGVIIAQDHDEAIGAIRDMMQGNAFGRAGARVVVEEFLEGEEASFIVIADGDHAIPFASSQDHKAAYDGDKGPNTGGMGAYSPAPVVTPAVYEKIMSEVIKPTIAGMKEDGNAYSGFLYAGLMIDSIGNPRVIEFNCRFGDPETQPVLIRMQSDLVQLCDDAIDGKLAGQEIAFDSRTALTVVMAAGGYPLDYHKGDEITDIPLDTADTKTFHAGTSLVNGRILTNGGRVLGVTALGNNVKEAQERAYQIVRKISYNNPHYRTDIGYRALERETGHK
ncbi:MAG: phosphoribosylamine--glycine ligase [bacterium]|nr:phosphoribosylamine--glycine ligase [Gammaproteobacteria bacterium]HIL95769.1 phosphoribosylamine--glycine ligase [Pseudomonadales bacterium]